MYWKHVAEAEGGNEEATLIDLKAAHLDLGPTVYTKVLQRA